MQRSGEAMHGESHVANHQPSRLRRARGKLFEVSAFSMGPLHIVCVMGQKMFDVGALQ